jgi:uncharacterized membrane protein
MGIDDGGFGGFDSGFSIVFAIVAVIIVLGIIAVIVLAVRNGAKARRAGLDPTTLNTDIAIRVLQSEALRGEQSVEQRLAKLDELTASGAISNDEHAAARARILGDI